MKTITTIYNDSSYNIYEVFHKQDEKIYNYFVHWNKINNFTFMPRINNTNYPHSIGLLDIEKCKIEEKWKKVLALEECCSLPVLNECIETIEQILLNKY